MSTVEDRRDALRQAIDFGIADATAKRHMRDLDGSLAYLEHVETVTALHEAEAEVRRLEADLRIARFSEREWHDKALELLSEREREPQYVTDERHSGR